MNVITTKLNINSIADNSIPKSKLNDSIFTGSYDNMTVGSANHADSATDLTGHNEPSEQLFTFQPSAGDMSIKDDSAYIKKIKGNSVVWNQNRKPESEIQGTQFSVTNSGSTLTLSAPSNAYARVAVSTHTAISGHKYLVSCNVISSAFSSIFISTNPSKIAAQGASIYSIGSFNGFVTPTDPTTSWFLGIATTTITGDEEIVVDKIRIRDLTKMFGAGNEPATVEDFYAHIPSGIDVNAYNEGEIINLNTESIKTIGFNQWDEQWINGRDPISDGNGLRCEDFIKVLPNTEYYLSNGDFGYQYGVVRYYDSNKERINYLDQPGEDHIFTTPTNCEYIVFYFPTDNPVTQYNNNICLNLSHTGWKNGTYEPYREFTREIPVIKKYFQNGMRSAGNAFDSIEWDSSKQKWVAVQRIGEVDLGSLTWTTDVVGDKVGFVVRNKVVNPPADIYSKVNMLCAKLTTVTQAGNTQYANDKVIFANGNGWLQAIDYRYTDATSFKSAMQGVMLYYELAEPIVTEIEEENINFDYYVEDFGTEEAISSVASASFSADIVYQFNAVDRIRDNDRKIDALRNRQDILQNTSVEWEYDWEDLGW